MNNDVSVTFNAHKRRSRKLTLRLGRVSYNLTRAEAYDLADKLVDAAEKGQDRAR